MNAIEILKQIKKEKNVDNIYQLWDEFQKIDTNWLSPKEKLNMEDLLTDLYVNSPDFNTAVNRYNLRHPKNNDELKAENPIKKPKQEPAKDPVEVFAAAKAKREFAAALNQAQIEKINKLKEIEHKKEDYDLSLKQAYTRSSKFGTEEGKAKLAKLQAESAKNFDKAKLSVLENYLKNYEGICENYEIFEKLTDGSDTKSKILADIEAVKEGKEISNDYQEINESSIKGSTENIKEPTETAKNTETTAEPKLNEQPAANTVNNPEPKLNEQPTTLSKKDEKETNKKYRDVQKQLKNEQKQVKAHQKKLEDERKNKHLIGDWIAVMEPPTEDEKLYSERYMGYTADGGEFERLAVGNKQYEDLRKKYIKENKNNPIYKDINKKDLERVMSSDFNKKVFCQFEKELPAVEGKRIYDSKMAALKRELASEKPKEPVVENPEPAPVVEEPAPKVEPVAQPKGVKLEEPAPSKDNPKPNTPAATTKEKDEIEFYKNENASFLVFPYKDKDETKHLTFSISDNNQICLMMKDAEGNKNVYEIQTEEGFGISESGAFCVKVKNLDKESPIKWTELPFNNKNFNVFDQQELLTDFMSGNIEEMTSKISKFKKIDAETWKKRVFEVENFKEISEENVFLLDELAKVLPEQPTIKEEPTKEPVTETPEPISETPADTTNVEEAQNLTYHDEATGVDYHYLPYETQVKSNTEADGIDKSYLRVMKQGDNTYINFNIDGNETTCQIFDASFKDAGNGEFLLNLTTSFNGKNGTFTLPIEASEANGKLLNSLNSLIKNEPVESKPIELKDCPVLDNLTPSAVNEFDNSVSRTNLYSRKKKNQELSTVSYNHAGQELTGLSQGIDMVKIGIDTEQQLTVYDAKGTDLLLNVTRGTGDATETIAKFVEKDGKVQMQLDSNYLAEFKKANPNVQMPVLEEKDGFASFEMSKLKLSKNGTIDSAEIKGANQDFMLLFSALGLQVRDKANSIGGLKNEGTPLNIGITDKGLDSCMKSELGCSMDRNDPLYSQILVARTQLERINQPNKIVSKEIGDVKIHSVPIKVKNEDGTTRQEYLNLRQENGKSYVYLHVKNEKEKGLTIPKYWEINNASFEESTKLNEKDSKIENSSVYLGLVAGKNVTSVNIPMEYSENLEALKFLKNQLNNEFEKTSNLDEASKANSFTRQLDSKDPDSNIRVYQRAGRADGAIESFGNVAKMQHEAGEIDFQNENNNAFHLANPAVVEENEHFDENTGDKNNETDTSTQSENKTETSNNSSDNEAEEAKEEKGEPKISDGLNKFLQSLVPITVILTILSAFLPFLAPLAMIAGLAYATYKVEPKVFIPKNRAAVDTAAMKKYSEHLKTMQKVNEAKLQALNAKKLQIAGDPKLSNKEKDTQLKKLDNQIKALETKVNETKQDINFMQNSQKIDETKQEIEQAKKEEKQIKKADQKNLDETDKQRNKLNKQLVDAENKAMSKKTKDGTTLTDILGEISELESKGASTTMDEAMRLTDLRAIANELDPDNKIRNELDDVNGQIAAVEESKNKMLETNEQAAQERKDKIEENNQKLDDMYDKIFNPNMDLSANNNKGADIGRDI